MGILNPGRGMLVCHGDPPGAAGSGALQKADALAAYVGLTPGQHSSGEHVRHGRITRQGAYFPCYLSGVQRLIEKDSDAGKILHEGGAGRKRAIVGVASNPWWADAQDPAEWRDSRVNTRSQQMPAHAPLLIAEHGDGASRLVDPQGNYFEFCTRPLSHGSGKRTCQRLHQATTNSRLVALASEAMKRTPYAWSLCGREIQASMTSYFVHFDTLVKACRNERRGITLKPSI